MIFKHVITIGREYKGARGGISQLIYNYKNYIFDTFHFVPNGKGKRSIPSYMTALVAPIRLLLSFLFFKNIRIVHIHTASYKPFKHACFFVSLSHFFGKKAILHIHGGGFKNYYEKNPLFVKRQLEKADAVIALSDSWKTFFREQAGIDNVYAVPNVIPPPQIMETTKSATFNLLFLGFIYQKKGIFDLIDVIIQNKERYRDRLKLYVGGTGQEYARLIDTINENGINDIVNLCGWVTGEDKIRLLNIADAYILPSYVEGLPVSILEAMSYGLPILSTPVGGIPEIVENGVNGFLFPPGDKIAMQNSIDKLISDSSLMKQMGAASLQKSKQYLPQEISQKLETIYNSLI